jgi:CIC family chloride channel protein
MNPSEPEARGLLALLRRQAPPLELELLGRVLLHSAVVGLGAGAIGVAFFVALELAQRFCLETLAGYVPLRAEGERFLGESGAATHFRPWVLVVLPGVGALLGGIVARFAPEVAGGGGDQMIQAFHTQGGVVRRRVIWVRALASLFTLGAGGAGGREGPTMHIGAALGSTLASWLRVTPRERRILMVAGVAAGMAAVFRTPLGAALLAVEVLYRDDFESDALVPAILASVIAYSVVIAVLGESTLFARPPRHDVRITHLPLFVLLAALVSVVGALFVGTLRRSRALFGRLRLPAWARPGVGGLVLGALVVPAIFVLGDRIHVPGQGLGLLGGGYGAAQVAITGASWMPTGWRAVELLAVLCGAKLIASSLTIGSGGSAGDFAPSLALGGLCGGAFGRAVQLLAPGVAIDPGAFALVGMGTFYGGIAHAPVSALILTCELAGSYDLLVPLMLSSGVAFVLLRRVSLYEAQPPTKAGSPAHGGSALPERLRGRTVAEALRRVAEPVSVTLATPLGGVLEALARRGSQRVIVVVDDAGRVRGVIPAEIEPSLRASDELGWAIAADVMQSQLAVALEADLRDAAALLVASGLGELPVVDGDGRVVGFVEEEDLVRAWVGGERAPA